MQPNDAYHSCLTIALFIDTKLRGQADEQRDNPIIKLDIGFNELDNLTPLRLDKEMWRNILDAFATDYISEPCKAERVFGLCHIVFHAVMLDGDDGTRH